MVKIMKLLNKGKEGLVIGAIVGFVVGKFFFPSEVLSIITQSQSIIDPLKNVATPAIEFAKTKAVLGMILLGSTIGFLIDINTPEGKFFKKFGGRR